MSFRCKNGEPHSHDTVEESRSCWNKSLVERTSATRMAPPQAGSLAYSSGDKLQQFLPMLDMVPEGYYAVRQDDEAPVCFIRLSRPSRANSKFKDCTIAQRVSGPDLDRGLIVFPPSQWNPDRRISVYDQRVVDGILLLICDYQGAAMRYADEIGKCARCNTRLTSDWRKYGIGPECVKHWPWMYEAAQIRLAEQGKS